VRRRVAVLFGGRSAEHEISIVSARSVIEALDPARYDVVAIGVTKEGRWHLMPGGPPALRGGASSGGLPGVAEGTGTEIALDQDPGSQALVASDGSRTEIDVVFPVMHGPFGEDGSIQGFLEMAGVPYVGCGVLASSCGMDKVVMKTLFRDAGLPVCRYTSFLRAEWEADRSAVARRVARQLGFPCFVKPANLGSSVGISRATNARTLEEAVDLAALYDRKVIVEEGVDAREIECAVLGGRGGARARASVPGEIVVDHDAADFYDFEAKYLSDSQARTDAPADLPDDVAERIRDLAVRAFEAIGAEGLSRVDFFVQPDGEVVINEINTMPGFTPISMYSKMWEASGMTYRELVHELIQLALERPTALR